MYARATLTTIVGCMMLVGVVCLVGCGEPEPTVSPIKGTVTLDGTPMPVGEILFRGQDQAAPVSRTLNINAGEFQGDVQPGKYKIEIFSYEIVPPAPTDTGYTPPEPMKINRIPPKWNSLSVVVVDVPQSGKDDFKFAVTSK